MVLATLAGAGHLTHAPGTVASALTVAVLWIVPFSGPALAAVLVAVVLAGTWAAGRAEALMGDKDPGAIVIDEVAGMVLSVLPFALTPGVLIAGFVLFRVFDIVKPPPARQIQRLPGGPGVMLDDLIAGLYAMAVLALSGRLLGWP